MSCDAGYALYRAMRDVRCHGRVVRCHVSGAVLCDAAACHVMSCDACLSHALYHASSSTPTTPTPCVNVSPRVAPVAHVPQHASSGVYVDGSYVQLPSVCVHVPSGRRREMMVCVGMNAMWHVDVRMRDDMCICSVPHHVMSHHAICVM